MTGADHSLDVTSLIQEWIIDETSGSLSREQVVMTPRSLARGQPTDETPQTSFRKHKTLRLASKKTSPAPVSRSSTDGQRDSPHRHLCGSRGRSLVNGRRCCQDEFPAVHQRLFILTAGIRGRMKTCGYMRRYAKIRFITSLFY